MSLLQLFAYADSGAHKNAQQVITDKNLRYSINSFSVFLAGPCPHYKYSTNVVFVNRLIRFLDILFFGCVIVFLSTYQGGKEI